uniref:ROK family protein n=1 Tax=Nocardia gipuzkoensis TaxID=2749991 RepID=UPI00245420EA
MSKKLSWGGAGGRAPPATTPANTRAGGGESARRRAGAAGRGCAGGGGGAGPADPHRGHPARPGAPAPAAALDRAGTALGRAVASAAALLDLDLVVLGGSIAEAGPALWKPLGEAVATHARLSFLPGLRVVPSQLGDIALLAGAGILAVTASA